jgi:hypothetical protein
MSLQLSLGLETTVQTLGSWLVIRHGSWLPAFDAVSIISIRVIIVSNTLQVHKEDLSIMQLGVLINLVTGFDLGWHRDTIPHESTMDCER